MTPKEAWETIVIPQMIKQGGPAITEDRDCVLVTKEGMKCALGALLPPSMVPKYVGKAGLDAKDRELLINMYPWLDEHNGTQGKWFNIFQRHHDQSATFLFNTWPPKSPTFPE